MKLLSFLSIATLFLLGSCKQAGTSARKFAKAEDSISGGQIGETNGAPNNNSEGDGAIAEDGNINDGNNNTDQFAKGKAELRHFIDPFDGTFKTKLTVPKNFTAYCI